MFTSILFIFLHFNLIYIPSKKGSSLNEHFPTMEIISSNELHSRVSLLRSISIFADLEDNLLQEIARALVPKSILAKEVLFEKGDEDYALYLIVAGKVKVHSGSHVFAHFSKNQYIGEYSLLDSSARSATVTAEEPTYLLRFDQKTFFDLIKSHPEITQAMLKGLVFRLRDYNKLEAELTQKNKEIEKQKTILEKQRTELEALNATKDKFFAIIAHDLKNPFSTVLSISELLAREFENFDSDSLKNFIHQIYKYSNNTFNLLENLLQWSMVQTGRMPLRPKIVNIKNIIDENVELLVGNANQKNIDIKVNAHKECSAYVDVNQITTVVRNLLSNAIKFTPSEGLIVVETEEHGNYWRITVKDTGLGISETNLSKLFQIDSNPTTYGTSQEKGTGLGLILCKEFVERNGGKIWVESKVGEGTSFFFTIPKTETENSNSDY